MSVINATPLLAAAGGDYQISRSVRLRSSASAYFNRTPGSGSNQKTFTFSGWIKRGALSGDNTFFCARQLSTSTPYFYLSFDNSTNILSLNANTCTLYTTAVYRDPSAWYHVVYAVDTTQATSSDRIKLYVNGVQVTTFGTASYPSLNADTGVNSAILHQIGAVTNGIGSRSQFFDGYLTEVNFIDGQALTPSSFGETDILTGVWKPKKYAGTYGTNGFYLNFSDNSNNTATTIGKDNSGNGNNWTPNNISVTAGVTYDSMIDVPTLYADGGNGRGNYAVLNPLSSPGLTAPSNGNLTIASTNADAGNWRGSIYGAFQSYFEVLFASGTGQPQIGIITPENTYPLVYNGWSGDVYSYGTLLASTGSSISAGDVLSISYNVQSGNSQIFKNGTAIWSGSITPVECTPYIYDVSGSSTITCHINFGQRPFAYTPPTGFKALNTQNLPAPTILKGNQYFDVTLWSGDNASPRTLTNSSAMQPDLVWLKKRGVGADNHKLYDSIRGAGNNTELESNTTVTEGGSNSDVYGYLSAFTSTGFTVSGGTDPVYPTGLVNLSGENYVGWQWKANGSAVTNTSGSITSQVNAGTSQGFSVVTYTGTGANATVGHGLGVAPKMIIVKRRSGVSNWETYHSSLGAAYYVVLDGTNAQINSTVVWNNTSPTSSVFSLGTGGNNTSSATYVAYCFSEVAGFSKFGSYTGNGSTDGPFVFCGFRPRYVLIKYSSGVENWFIADSSRDTYNVAEADLVANSSVAEGTVSAPLDFVSNGFKIRTTATGANASSGTYIFAAFAEAPFKNSLAR